MLFKLDFDKLSCTAETFGQALTLEGIEGVHDGYPFFPTDHAWYRDAVIYGSSGLPWTLVQQRPHHFELPNAHAANRQMIRVEVHEQLGTREARHLGTAIKKIARHYAMQ